MANRNILRDNIFLLPDDYYTKHPEYESLKNLDPDHLSVADEDLLNIIDVLGDFFDKQKNNTGLNTHIEA